MTQVFISYAHKDLRKVEDFLAQFEPARERLNLVVWMDPSITAGSQWSAEIEAAIDASDIFLLFVTNFWIGSKYILKTEWPLIKAAVGRRDAISIPIILDDSDWLHYFSAVQCIPHSPHTRQLLPITDWEPPEKGHRAAGRACVDAIAPFLSRDRLPKPPNARGMVATDNGLDLTTTPGSAAELSDPTNLSLHGEIRALIDSIVANLARPKSGNHVGDDLLEKLFAALAHEVNRPIGDLDPVRAWATGADFATSVARLNSRPELASYDDNLRAQFDHLLTRAQPFLMGFEAARVAQSRASVYRAFDPDRTTTLQTDTARLLEGMLRWQGLLASETQAFVAAMLAPLRDAYQSNDKEARASTLEPAVRTGIEALAAIGNALSLLATLEPINSPAKSNSRLGRFSTEVKSYLRSEERDIAAFAGGEAEIRRFALRLLEIVGDKNYGITVGEMDGSAAKASLDPLPDDFDYEAEAKKLILGGISPPKEWVPKIRTLRLWGEENLIDLSPLSGLTGLLHLYVNSTGVTDLSPLSGLTALTVLDVSGTGVTDLSPLSGLTGLKTLYLSRTGVTDLSPLSGLTGLKTLYLSRTGVTDLSPLSGLTGLQWLDASSTGVTDLSPLSGLTGLQALFASGTGVTDLSPLSNLKDLETLNISGNRVWLLEPIARLMGLKTLVIGGNPLIDLSPLADLTALKHLLIYECPVSMLSPLEYLESLETLYLNDTFVADLSSIGFLPNLVTLNVSNSHVSDLSKLEFSPKLKVIAAAGRSVLAYPIRLPNSCNELVLLGRPWMPGFILPDVKYRIDPDGTVHDPDGEASDLFIQWADHAATFRETGKLPGEA